jgi:hypothetical protein
MTPTPRTNAQAALLGKRPRAGDVAVRSLHLGKGPADRGFATAALAGPTGWRAEPVSTWVNSVDHDDARCIEPLGNPAQGELF